MVHYLNVGHSNAKYVNGQTQTSDTTKTKFHNLIAGDLRWPLTSLTNDRDWLLHI